MKEGFVELLGDYMPHLFWGLTLNLVKYKE
jgi:hypothetical protein